MEGLFGMRNFSVMGRIRFKLLCIRFVGWLQEGATRLLEPIIWRVRYGCVCLQLAIGKKKAGGKLYEYFES